MTGGLPVMSGAVHDTSRFLPGSVALGRASGAAGGAGGSATSVTLTVTVEVWSMAAAEEVSPLFQSVTFTLTVYELCAS